MHIGRVTLMVPDVRLILDIVAESSQMVGLQKQDTEIPDRATKRRSK